MKANLKFLTLPPVCKTIGIAIFVASLQPSNENSDICMPQKVCYGRSSYFNTKTHMQNILMFEEQSRKPVTNDISTLIQIIFGRKLWDENF